MNYFKKNADKFLHFSVGVLLAVLVFFSLFAIQSFLKKDFGYYNYIAAISVVCFFAFWKEKKDDNSYGKFDLMDFLWTNFGGVLALLCVYF